MKSTLSPEARLAFLWQASHALGSSLDYETTLRTVARLIVPTLADWVAVDLADEGGELQRLAVVHADPARASEGWDPYRGEPADFAALPGPAPVYRTGEPVLYPAPTREEPDDSAAGDGAPRHIGGPGVTSLLIVPLAGRERRLGTITLATVESGRRYGPDELALAQEIAGRAGMAVEHARLYLAEQRARAEAEAAAARAARLLALGSALAGDISARDVARTSLAQALPALGAWAGSFYTIAPDGGTLELLHYEGYPPSLMTPWHRIALDAPIPLVDAVHDGPIFLETRSQWVERYAHLDAVRAGTASGAVAAVPLVSNDRAIGVIGLSFAAERAFSPEDRDFMVIVAGHCAQVLDRVHAATALRDSEARFRSVVESGMLGIAFWDGGTVTEANDQFLDLLGYDRQDVAAGRLHHGVLTPPEHEPADTRAYAECLERGNCAPYEKEFYRRDGSRVPVLVGGALLRADRRLGVFFVLDLTDRRRVEAQIQAAQRMEAVGRLAGGVAHEINNALQGVLGFASFVRRSLPAGDPRLRDVVEIEKAGTRAADITHQLLAFSRRQARQPRDIDVRRTVTEFVPILQQALGPERELVVVSAEADASVLADQGQLEQVLLNLTLNARDAMPGDGRLTIAIERVVVGPRGERTGEGAPETGLPPPGTYVRIEVRDTGTGMAPGVRERIFEPFFTTKEPGKGTGLGLSVVYGIVRQSGGFITAESEPGRGSVFRIHLPAATPDLPLAEARAPASPPGGLETVLVVDDEPSVLAVASRTLAEAGYRVVAAGNGVEALEVLRRREGIALVLSDVLMPVLGGEELVRRVAAEWPAVRLLLTSGHPENAGRVEGLPRHGMLPKPFGPDDLLRAVRERLDQRAD